MKPTVGRIVHYTYNDEGKVCPAIVVEVYEHDVPGRVLAFIIRPVAPSPELRIVPFAETPKSGHWHWPQRSA